MDIFQEWYQERRTNMTNRFLLNMLFGVVLTSNVVMASQEDITLREQWINDSNYIQGVVYLTGEQGADIIKKEISNCPYDKCKTANIEKKEFNPITVIEIKKPNYKKAVGFLYESMRNGNVLAAEKLVGFLMGQLDYKSKEQDSFLVEKLEQDVGINIERYKEIFIDSSTLGVRSGKGCVSSFVYGEIFEFGLLGKEKNKEESVKGYSGAYNNCKDDTMYKILAKNKAIK